MSTFHDPNSRVPPKNDGPAITLTLTFEEQQLLLRAIRPFQNHSIKSHPEGSDHAVSVGLQKRITIMRRLASIK